MENERGQGKSLSSDSTQSKIAQDSISDDVNVEAEKESREEEEWLGKKRNGMGDRWLVRKIILQEISQLDQVLREGRG